MRLILGPPGSGKTTSCLEQLRAALRANRGDCRLIVPTATMGEHLRNELSPSSSNPIASPLPE
jgi:adenylate kinase family enzyme